MRASLIQSSFSVVLTNSVGLKLGSFFALMAFTLSSYFWEMVVLIVLEAGISMSSPDRFWFGMVVVVVSVMLVDELVELDDCEEDDEEEDVEEQELLSLSESEGLSTWGGMLPV